MTHISMTFSVSWSGDGNRIAVGDTVGKIHVLNTVGETLLEISEDSIVNCLDWSPSTNYLASGTSQSIGIWDGRTGSLIARLTGHESNIMDVSWSPDGEFLASGGLDGDLKLWDMKTGELIISYDLGADRVSRICWDQDSSMLATMVSQPQIGQVLIVMRRDGGIVWSNSFPTAGNRIDWSSNGKWLLVPTEGNPMIFTKWGYHICNLTQTSWGEESQWSPIGNYLASGGYDGVLKIYGLDILVQIPENPLGMILLIFSISLILKRGRQIISVGGRRW
jgi:WD40 repeat protein